MAWLSVAKRKQYFKELGLGDYNKNNIKKFQKKYMLRKSDYDGIYGTNTDNLLRHVYNVSVWLPKQFNGKSNFKPEEFRCDCGGRYCSGYPTYMKQNALYHIQTIRNHWGRPITVTQGCRCSGRNRQLNGSIVNSKHLTGRAIDFYQRGVTDTLANRKKAIKYIKKLKNHTYTYGSGINSYGYAVRASYMGNCLHTDVK